MRDSSLSAGTQAVLAAETGHLQLAYDYLTEAAFMDLDDLERNTRDGLHMAALAGCWIALVAGLGGMRHRGVIPSFAPRLPPQLTRLAFTITLRGRRLRLEVTAAAAAYTLLDGAPLDITHHGQPITISAGTPDVAPIPPAPAPGPTPTQPPGREPARRRRSSQPATTTPPTTDGTVNNPIR